MAAATRRTAAARARHRRHAAAEPGTTRGVAAASAAPPRTRGRRVTRRPGLSCIARASTDCRRSAPRATAPVSGPDLEHRCPTAGARSATRRRSRRARRRRPAWTTAAPAIRSGALYGRRTGARRPTRSSASTTPKPVARASSGVTKMSRGCSAPWPTPARAREVDRAASCADERQHRVEGAGA